MRQSLEQSNEAESLVHGNALALRNEQLLALKSASAKGKDFSLVTFQVLIMHLCVHETHKPC